VKIKSQDFRANSLYVDGYQDGSDVSFLKCSDCDYRFVTCWVERQGLNALFKIFDKHLNPEFFEGSAERKANLANPPAQHETRDRVSVDSYQDGKFILQWAGHRFSEPSPDSIFIQFFNRDGSFIYLDGETGKNTAIAMGLEQGEGPAHGIESNNVAVFRAGDGNYYGFSNWTWQLGIDQDNQYATHFWILPLGGEDYTSLHSPKGHLDHSLCTGGACDYGGDVDVGINGNFIIDWEWNSDPDRYIRFLRYDMQGNDLDTDPREFPFLGDINFPRVEVDSENRILFAWAEQYGGSIDIRAKRFYSGGNIDASWNTDDFDIGGSYPVADRIVDVASIHAPLRSPYDDDYYVFTWEADPPEGGDNAIFARIMNEDGSAYGDPFRVTDNVVRVEQNPRVDVYRDRFVICWELSDGLQSDVYFSAWSVDDEAPQVSNTHDYLARIWGELPAYLPVTTHAHEVTEGLYPSGLDMVRLIARYHYSRYIAECDETDTLQMDYQSDDLYLAFLEKDDLKAGTTVTYYAEVNDNALNFARDPFDYHDNPLVFYVANRGDLNVNGFIDWDDVGTLCAYLAGEIELEPHEEVFADYNSDGLITCNDYQVMWNVADELPPIQQLPCIQNVVGVGDLVEMSVGAGNKGQVVTLPLYLENDSTEVRDLYYSIEFDTTAIKLTGESLTPRSQGYTIFEECCGDVRPIGLLGGENAISCGHGSVMNLTFTVKNDAPDGSYHITLSKGALGDSLSEPFPHWHLRGKFFIPSAPPVSIVCTPVSDTGLVRGDTLRFNTTLTNHHWQGVTASVFMYGTVTPEGMNPFLVVDTTHVFIPQGARVKSVTEIGVPQYAPLVHYEFTGYVCEASNVYDTDTFDFSVTDTLGKMGARPGLASAGEGWKLLSGWFGEATPLQGQMSSNSDLPRSFALSQNYPNPFNPVTEIVYFIPERETSGVPVELVIYDMRGRLIRKFSEGTRKPGKHTIIWDGKDSRGGHVGSGVYLYLLKAGEYEGTRKMVLMR
jgi:hypothetical protein